MNKQTSIVGLKELISGNNISKEELKSIWKEGQELFKK